jgi:hypothetical protein
MTTAIDWESEIVALLDELMQAQDAMLDVLSQKRQCMARNDLEGMQALDASEEQARQRLEACHRRRQQLLRAARQRNLPCESLGKLAGSPLVGARGDLGKQVQAASARLRLLQHESWTNWVVAQRSLLHYSQMLEILATGGRPDPTYKDNGVVPRRGGALLDQEA